MSHKPKPQGDSRFPHIYKRLDDLETIVHPLRDAPRENNEQPATPQDNSSNKTENAPRQMPVVSPSPSDASKTNKTEREPNPWWKQWKPWKRLLGILGVGIGIGYACVTYFQWRDLRHNFEIDQRAWLEVTTNLGKTNDIPYTVEITVKNLGKSVATGIIGAGAFEIASRDNQPMFTKYQQPHTAVMESIIFPGSSDQWNIQHLDANGAYTFISPEDINRNNRSKST
jgi:F0F1-type ATP synthase membrane subunit c/vacuolar-type H+-ATPase subunit K